METERIELSRRERDWLKVLHEVEQKHLTQVEAAQRLAIRTAELNRRVQVTATKSWGPTLTESVGTEVDSQVAAPTETRTPNWHRATIAHKRVRMEGWRQRRLG